MSKEFGRNVWYNCWIEFCLSTGIRGFSYIVKSSYIPEKLLWLVIIIAGLCLTLSDVSSSFSLYMSEETVSRITVKSNETLSLGQPTVCVEFDTSIMKSSRIMYENTSSVEEALRTFDKTVNLTTYLSNNRPAPGTNWSTIYTLALFTLTRIVHAEQFASPDIPLESFNFGITRRLDDTSYGRYTVPNSFATMVKVQKFLSAGHNFTQLIGAVGTAMCRILNFVVIQNYFQMGQWKDNYVDPCKPSSISWFGTPPTLFLDKEVICVQLDPGIASFRRPSESLIFTLSNNNIYRFNYESNNTGYVYVNLNDDFISVESSNILWMSVDSSVSVDIMVTGHYKEISSVKDPCGPISLDSCRLECRMRYLMKYCGCKPLSSRRFWNSNLPTCGQKISVEHSENQSILGSNPECLVLHRVTDPDQSCVEKCLRPCDYKIFSFSTFSDKSIKKKWKTHDATTVVSLSVDPFTFPLVEEFPIMTYKQFVAAIGGNMSIYLGISFVALIHIVVFLLRNIFNHGMKDNRVSVDLTTVTVESR